MKKPLIESRPVLWLLEALSKAAGCILFIVSIIPSVIILMLQDRGKRR